jgi:hypothetical protein
VCLSRVALSHHQITHAFEQESDNGMVEFEAFLKNCLPTEKLSNLTLLELHFNIIPKHALGKAEDLKGSLNLASRGRGGRKQSVGGDDDDFEDEEDGRESLNDDEDEYVPARNGRARGGRGKGRGGQRSKQRADEERESDDQAGGGMMDYHNGANEMFADVSSVTVIERKVPVVTYTHSKAITRALCRLIWYPMNEEVRRSLSLSLSTGMIQATRISRSLLCVSCRTRCPRTSCWRSFVNILLHSCSSRSLSMIDTTWPPCSAPSPMVRLALLR